MTAYVDAMRRYSDFSRRASRKAFWLFMLVYFIILLVATAIDVAIQPPGPDKIPIISGIVALVHLIPGIATTVRRLHDFNQSAWLLIPCVIPLVLIAMMLIPGTPGPNRYGASAA